MKPFPKAVKRKLQKKPVQCLANKGAVGSHATPQGQYCRAFLGLPLFFAIIFILDSHSEKQQIAQITTGSH